MALEWTEGDREGVWTAQEDPFHFTIYYSHWRKAYDLEAKLSLTLFNTTGGCSIPASSLDAAQAAAAEVVRATRREVGEG